MAFYPFLPANGEFWLRPFADSLVDLFRQKMPAPFRLKDYATADLPTADTSNKAGVVYDDTLSALKYSTGSAWVRLSEYDADVAAYAALSTTGLVARTGAGTVATRTLTAPAAGITVSDGDGVAGNPTLALANDLAALEALSTTGIVCRDGTSSYQLRSITGTSNEITVTNGGGVLGAPTVSIPTAVTFTGKTVTGGTYTSVEGLTTSVMPTFNSSLNGVMAVIDNSNATAGTAGIKIRATGASQKYWVIVNGFDAASELDFRVSTAAAGDPYTAGTTIVRFSPTGVDVIGEARCDTLRLDATATAAAVAQSHHVPININGTVYKLLLAT